MSATTKIEWTDRTWNPTTGCTKVSPGCDHCYAETLHERFNGKGSFATVTVHPERFAAPLTWRKPARVFVNSMSDLFHRDIPVSALAEIWAVMALTPQHTYQVLTKRHARMQSLLSGDLFQGMVADAAYLMAHPRFPSSPGDQRVRDVYAAWPAALPGVRARRMPWPLQNVWLGVSAEDQHWADVRLPALMETPAEVRFVSAEPLLGPLDLTEYLRCGHDNQWHVCDGCALDWVIVGGESGPHARPMHPDWARSMRDQCAAAGVAYFFKQWGEWAPTGARGIRLTPGMDPRVQYVGPDLDDHGNREEIRRVGKKAAGRLLDGRTHDEYPNIKETTHA